MREVVVAILFFVICGVGTAMGQAADSTLSNTDIETWDNPVNIYFRETGITIEVYTLPWEPEWVQLVVRTGTKYTYSMVKKDDVCHVKTRVVNKKGIPRAISIPDKGCVQFDKMDDFLRSKLIEQKNKNRSLDTL